MKTLKQFQKLLFCITALTALNLNRIEAQAPPIDGPGMHWFKEQWLDMGTVSQSESGEDWYYDLRTYKEDGVVAGYIAAGFSNRGIYKNNAYDVRFGKFNLTNVSGLRKNTFKTDAPLKDDQITTVTC